MESLRDSWTNLFLNVDALIFRDAHYIKPFTRNTTRNSQKNALYVVRQQFSRLFSNFSISP